MMKKDPVKESLKTTYLIYPLWGALFFLSGGIFVIVIGVSVWLILDLSVASDRVFAIEALLSGILAEKIVFRRMLNRKLVVAPKFEIPFIYFWLILCFYVFIARPFE